MQKGPEIHLALAQAEAALRQFQETAAHREWRLIAAAVMHNHFHLVVAADESVEARKLLTDLKAYASRALNSEFGEPAGGRWWTKGGSTRLLPDERAVESATLYVLERQPNPLAVWPR